MKLALVGHFLMTKCTEKWRVAILLHAARQKKTRKPASLFLAAGLLAPEGMMLFLPFPHAFAV